MACLLASAGFAKGGRDSRTAGDHGQREIRDQATLDRRAPAPSRSTTWRARSWSCRKRWTDRVRRPRAGAGARRRGRRARPPGGEARGHQATGRAGALRRRPVPLRAGSMDGVRGEDCRGTARQRLPGGLRLRGAGAAALRSRPLDGGRRRRAGARNRRRGARPGGQRGGSPGADARRGRRGHGQRRRAGRDGGGADRRVFTWRPSTATPNWWRRGSTPTSSSKR